MGTVGGGGAVQAVFDICLNVGIVVGPVLGYWDQIFKMIPKPFRDATSGLIYYHAAYPLLGESPIAQPDAEFSGIDAKAKNVAVESFSPLVSGVLIVCNLLRLFYRQCHLFATALILQSVLMLYTQLTLLSVALPASTYKTTWGRFWAVLFAGIVAMWVFTYGNPIIQSDVAYTGLMWQYVGCEGMGVLALGVEATLLMPQVKTNYERYSTDGLSWALLFTWVGGDIMKLVYFLIASQPIVFVGCSIVQLSVDTVLVYQCISYPKQPTNTVAPVKSWSPPV